MSDNIRSAKDISHLGFKSEVYDNTQLSTATVTRNSEITTCGNEIAEIFGTKGSKDQGIQQQEISRFVITELTP